MVNSISWGSYEEDYSQSSLDSFNNEAVALANMGTTILVSSGDDGVSGSGCDCTDDSSSNQVTDNYTPQGGATWTGTGYFPSFPASNPYGKSRWFLIVLSFISFDLFYLIIYCILL